MPKIGIAVREQRRQQLLGAAWRCIAERGYRTVTVDDICREAGLSKGAFYTYFSAKRDALIALLDEEAAEMRAVMDDLSTGVASGMDRVRRVVETAVSQAERPAQVQLRADLWAEMQQDADLQDRMRSVAASRRRLLAAWINEAVAAGEVVDTPANAFAAVLIALLDGLMLHRALDPGGFRWQNVRRTLDALLAGVSPPADHR